MMILRPFSPRLSFGLNGDYHWSLTTGSEAHLGASLRHLSHQSGAFDPAFVTANNRQRRVRPYNVVDLNAGVNFGQFSIDAFAKNVGNSHGVTSTTGTTVFGAFPVYPGRAIGTGIIRARTIGLSLTASY